MLVTQAGYLIIIYKFRFTDEDVDEMYREAPIKNGMFDYTEFTRILKHGAKEKDEAQINSKNYSVFCTR